MSIDSQQYSKIPTWIYTGQKWPWTHNCRISSRLCQVTVLHWRRKLARIMSTTCHPWGRRVY